MFWGLTYVSVSCTPTVNRKGQVGKRCVLTALSLVQDLMNRMLDLDATRRITMQGVLQHPWLQILETEAEEVAYLQDMQSRR